MFLGSEYVVRWRFDSLEGKAAGVVGVMREVAVSFP